MGRQFVKYGVSSILLLVALCGGSSSAYAQIRIVSQQQLDQTGNPQLAAGAEALHFEQTTLRVDDRDEDAASIETDFVCENRGKTPLVITRIESSCSCFSARFDRKPLAAGGRMTIRTEYRQKGHPGVYMRRLFVYTQLSATAPTAILTLEGTVTQGSSRYADYPHQMGSLRLRQSALHFDAADARQQVLRIEFVNAGAAAVSLTADAMLTPRYVALRSEPSTVEPNQTGEIVVTLLSDARPTTLPASIPVLCNGIRTAPAARTLKLYFDAKN